MHVSSEAFLDICSEQMVRLDPDISKALALPADERSLHYGQHPYVQAAPSLGELVLLASRIV